jgi:branched-chain amino acid transport system substrate-binding protein
MNKKIIWSAVIVIVLIIIAVFINQNKNIDQNKKPIKLGTSLALTGSLAYIGEAERNGLQMGVEDVNINGGVNGHKLELIAEDNAGLAASAVSGAQKLISSDKVSVLITAFTHITQAVKGLSTQAGIPMLYISAFPDIAKESPLFFRDYFDSANLGKVIANYIIKTDIKKVAYLGEQSDACFPYRDESKRILEANNIKVVIEEQFLGDATDLRAQLSKIKAAKVDGIVTCTWRKSDIFMNQLSQLGMLSVPTFQLNSPFLPNADTQAMRSLYVENKTISTWYGFSAGSLNDAQQKFAKRYMDKFGKTLPSDAAFAYDDIMVISKALKLCIDDSGKVDNACFTKELLKTDYNGVAGKLTFNADGISQREGILIKIVDGEWVQIAN